MKKAIILLALCLLVFGCSKSEDDFINGAGVLIGKWNFNKINIEYQAEDPKFGEVIEAEKISQEKEQRNTYLEFRKNGKYTDSYAVTESTDYYVKDGCVYIFYSHDGGEGWVKRPYRLSGTNNNVLTYVGDLTDWYKGRYPQYGITNAVFYTDYVKAE